jgi:chemotaxis protein methyltransferase CheR
VSFQVVNMSNLAALKQLPRPDMILCRNALIYFDKDSKTKTANSFAQALRPHGYFFLGRAESLFGVEHPFEMVHFFQTSGFRLPQSS